MMWIVLLIIVAVVAIVLFGALGFLGVGIAAFVIASIWWLAPVALLVVVGVIGLLALPLLRLLGPRSWEMVKANRAAENLRKGVSR